MAARARKGKELISVLTSFLILCSFSGCQQVVDKAEPPDRLTAESGDNIESATGEPAIDAALADVISCYADYLQQYCDQSSNFTANNLHYSLVYIDEDNIPELAVIEDNSHASGVHICVYRDGAVIEIGEFGSFGAFLYSLRQNVIYSGFSNMGEGFASIFCIDGIDSTELQSFHSYPVYGDDDEYETDIYELDGQVVSEETFDEAYEKWRTSEMESLSYQSPSCYLFTDKDSAYAQMVDLLFL